MAAGGICASGVGHVGGLSRAINCFALSPLCLLANDITVVTCAAFAPLSTDFQRMQSLRRPWLGYIRLVKCHRLGFLQMHGRAYNKLKKREVSTQNLSADKNINMAAERTACEEGT